MGRKRAKGVHADEELYEVDFIRKRKLVDGECHYLIRWKGYDEKADTWEPLSNLAGIEPEVAAFEAKLKKECMDGGWMDG